MSGPVYDYLNRELTNRPERHVFRQLGPHSFIYESDSDETVVFANRDNVIILHDGPHVLHSMTMIPPLDDCDEDGMNHYYLQPILGKF